MSIPIVNACFQANADEQEDLLGSNVDTALTVVTSLFIERIVHTRIIEILVSIVSLNSLEDAESTESRRGDNRNDDSGNCSSREANGKNIILAKNRLLKAARTVDANANIALAPGSAVLEIRNTSPERIARVDGAGLAIIAGGYRSVDTTSCSISNFGVATVIGTLVAVIALGRGINWSLNARITCRRLRITRRREALVRRVAGDERVIAMRRCLIYVKYIESASILVVAIGEVTNVERLAAKSRITRSLETRRVGIGSADDRALDALAGGLLAHRAIARSGRSASLSLRSFAAREACNSSRLETLSSARKSIVAIIGRDTGTAHAHAATAITTAAVCNISSTGNRLDI